MQRLHPNLETAKHPRHPFRRNNKTEQRRGIAGWRNSRLNLEMSDHERLFTDSAADRNPQATKAAGPVQSRRAIGKRDGSWLCFALRSLCPRAFTMSTAPPATTSDTPATVPDASSPAQANPEGAAVSSGGVQEGDVQAINYFKEAHAMIKHQLAKVIVGQDKVIDELLISIFTRSHALLVGVPGLAKTLLISTLAQTINLSFKRIQFTPDLMPSDITGTEVIYSKSADR